MQFTHRLAAGVLAASLVATGAGTTFAKSGHAAKSGRSFAYGQVSGLGTTGFTLTRQKAAKAGQTAAPTTVTVQVSVSTTTVIKARKGETGTLANGDYARVVGAKSGTGIAATHVVFSAKPFRGLGLRAAGTVVTATSTSLTVQPRTRKNATAAPAALTFDITKAHFRVNGQKATTSPTFTSGEAVRVRYRKNATTGVLTATVVAVGTASK